MNQIKCGTCPYYSLDTHCDAADKSAAKVSACPQARIRQRMTKEVQNESACRLRRIAGSDKGVAPSWT